MRDIKEKAGFASERAEFGQQIAYGARIGPIFKESVSISLNGIRFGEDHLRLEEITRIRWRGTRRAFGRIPFGTQYMIMVGAGRRTLTVRALSSRHHGAIVDRIWRAVGIRLLFETIDKLRLGEPVAFGPALLRDDGISFIRHRFFGASRHTMLTWDQLQVWSENRSFFVGTKRGLSYYVRLSYQLIDNVHVLENLVRAFLDSGRPSISAMAD